MLKNRKKQIVKIHVFTFESSSFNLHPLQLPCYNKNKTNEVIKAMDPEMIQMTARLAELTIRNTASSVFEKIKVSKAKKDDTETIAELTDIIQELINEKQELGIISQAFERELATQKLSDDDIAFVGNTVLPVIKEFASKNKDGNQEFLNSIETMEPLISQNTLQVLQMLGFNFKKAIGEPLTDLLSKKIRSLSVENSDEVAVTIAKRDVEYFKILQDKNSFDRFQQMNGH